MPRSEGYSSNNQVSRGWVKIRTLSTVLGPFQEYPPPAHDDHSSNPYLCRLAVPGLELQINDMPPFSLLVPQART